MRKPRRDKKQRDVLYVNGAEATEAVRGDRITFPFATRVTAKNKLYKILPQ